MKLSRQRCGVVGATYQVARWYLGEIRATVYFAHTTAMI